MSSLRALSVARTSFCRKVFTRSVTTKSAVPPPRSNKGLVALGAAAVVGVAGGYGLYKNYGLTVAKEELMQVVRNANPISVHAAAPPTSQPSVFSQGKDHALYLWIHLKPTANAKEVMKVAAKLQSMVDTVVDPTMKDEDDEIWAGVGFGPNFFSQMSGKTKKNFTYPHRKGANGDMPSSGGDVFIHAKSNTVSKLFELCQCFMHSLPKDSVESFEDIYSFVYQNGRDLSGFIDGTENRADDDERKVVAVETETGGSYVITQKWIHDLDTINTQKTKTLEAWMGREKSDSTEIYRKSISSHVARMTGGNSFQQPKPVEIVRQSMPFGNLSGNAGLFFIAYAKDPYNFEFMLDRMVGAGGDGQSDDVMRLSKNVKGTYWYFPGEKELASLA